MGHECLQYCTVLTSHLGTIALNGECGKTNKVFGVLNWECFGWETPGSCLELLTIPWEYLTPIFFFFIFEGIEDTLQHSEITGALCSGNTPGQLKVEYEVPGMDLRPFICKARGLIYCIVSPVLRLFFWRKRIQQLDCRGSNSLPLKMNDQNSVLCLLIKGGWDCWGENQLTDSLLHSRYYDCYDL